MSFGNIRKICSLSDKNNTKEVHCFEPLQWNDIVFNNYHKLANTYNGLLKSNTVSSSFNNSYKDSDSPIKYL